jgi:hypothetical protein
MNELVVVWKLKRMVSQQPQAVRDRSKLHTSMRIKH